MHMKSATSQNFSCGSFYIIGCVNDSSTGVSNELNCYTQVAMIRYMTACARSQDIDSLSITTVIVPRQWAAHLYYLG